MEFTTKRELLRYLGKNQNDRKLVDRMIARGQVEYYDGVYSVMDRKEDELIEEVKELRKEVEKLEADNAKLETQLEDIKMKKDGEETESSSSGEIDKELLERFSLVWNRNKKKMDGIKKLIQSTYNRYGGQKSWEESVALVYRGMGLNEEDFVGEEDEMARDKEKYRIKEE